MGVKQKQEMEKVSAQEMVAWLGAGYCDRWRREQCYSFFHTVTW